MSIPHPEQRKPYRKRLTSCLAFFLMLCLLLTACGISGTADSAQKEESPEESTQEDSRDMTRKRLDIRMGLQREESSFPTAEEDSSGGENGENAEEDSGAEASDEESSDLTAENSGETEKEASEAAEESSEADASGTSVEEDSSLQGEAQDLTATLQFFSDYSDEYWETCTDEDYETYHYLYEDIRLMIVADQPMQGIWVIWNYDPGEWSVEAGGNVYTGGEYGIIHEYIAFDDPTRVASLNLPEDAQLCDIYAFSEGDLPSWVQVWNPPCEQADMLLFPTHSDDELIFFGGVLPTYAGEEGLKVQVCYMTYHDQPRPHELLNGLWTCGDTYYPVISNNYDEYCYDIQEAFEIYGEDAFLSYQVECIRRFKPSVIVCQAENGEYGHGAHRLNCYCVKEAVEIANDPEQYTESAEEYGVWDTPKLYLHLYEENQLVMDWHVPLEKFGGETALEVARDAYDCHISQHIYSFQVLEEGYGDCRLFGLYRSTVGEDTPGVNDMMEHIEPLP